MNSENLSDCLSEFSSSETGIILPLVDLTVELDLQILYRPPEHSPLTVFLSALQLCVKDKGDDVKVEWFLINTDEINFEIQPTVQEVSQ